MRHFVINYTPRRQPPSVTREWIHTEGITPQVVVRIIPPPRIIQPVIIRLSRIMLSTALLLVLLAPLRTER